MGETTGISWTDHTLNFWQGCFKVSPGCAHCYAEALANRRGLHIFGPPRTTKRFLTRGPWRDCVRWDKKAGADGVRRKVFVMSMGDFFEDHPQVNPWREAAFMLLEKFKNLDVQLLTKRPENILKMVPPNWEYAFPPHIWIGTSVENQEQADKRIPELLKVPARIRFLSVEPMLEQIDFHRFLPSLQWLIFGGESGPEHRELNLKGLALSVGQCLIAGVPVFVKQDSGFKPGQRGRIPDELWLHEFPQVETNIPQDQPSLFETE